MKHNQSATENSSIFQLLTVEEEVEGEVEEAGEEVDPEEAAVVEVAVVDQWKLLLLLIYPGGEMW